MEFKFANEVVSYIGIGSKNAPSPVLNTFKRLGVRFAELGFILRSTQQTSSDIAFIEGCEAASGKNEIWLPWVHGPSENALTPTTEAHWHCSKTVPGFDRLQSQSKLIYARLTNLILGSDVESPASFVICWSDDGCESDLEKTNSTGEISQAVVMASMAGIPVFNLGREGAISRLTPLVEKLKVRPSQQEKEATIDGLLADKFVMDMNEVLGVSQVVVTSFQSLPKEVEHEPSCIVA